MWYAKARYYNPDLGRFAAEDPIKGNILDIQSLNLYPYVKNNPLKYIDPDGRRHVEIGETGGTSTKPDYLGEDLVGNREQRLTFISIDFDKLSEPQQDAINELLKWYENPLSLLDALLLSDEEYAELEQERKAMYLDYIFDIIDLSEDPAFQKYLTIRNRVVDTVSGTFQLLGGLGEVTVGTPIAIGSSWTGIGIPIGLGGSYIVVDGISNITGGTSKVINGLTGSALDWNFMKKAYTTISPDYGDTIYSLTQIGIGLFTIGKGLTELPDDAVKVYPRAKNIARAKTKKLLTETIVLEIKDKIIITTQEINPSTSTPMILQRTVIDKTKIQQGSTLIIGTLIDGYNVNDTIKSFDDN